MLKLAKEVFTVQAWQGLVLLCATIVQLAVARFIGAEGLGVMAVIVSGSAFCILTIELNLQSAIVRSIANASNTERELVRLDIQRGRTVLALLIAPVVALCLAGINRHYAAAILLGTIGVVLVQLLNPSWWLQGRGEAGKSFRLLGAVALGGCIISLPMVYFVRQPGLEILAVSLVGLLIYGSFWHTSSGLWHIGLRWREYVRIYWAYAWKNRGFLLGGAAVYLYLYPTQLLLASYRSVEEAGLYRVALMPGGAYYPLAVAAFSAYYPQLLRSLAIGQDEFEKTIMKTLVLAGCVGAVACIALLGLLPLFRIAIGPEFEEAIALAPLLMVSKAIGGVSLVIRAALLARAKETLVFGLFLGIGLLSLATNTFIIPRHGYAGAAWVEISMESLHFIVLLGLFVRGRKK